MQAADFPTLLNLLQEGRVDVESVGAFWPQARRARVAGGKQPIVAVPVTFHLVGELRSVAYAQLLAGPGLDEAYANQPRATLVWQLRATGLPPLAFAEFALPVLGLFWAGDAHSEAQALGNRLLEILIREFPNPEWELEQQYGTTLERIFARLAETEYLEAGSTLRATQQ